MNLFGVISHQFHGPIVVAIIGKIVIHIQILKSTYSVSWSSDGEIFAFSSGHLFYLFNTTTWNEIMHTSPFEEYDHPILESISISPNRS